MRYIIETVDEQGLIGIQIDKWKKEKKINLIEKADPVIELKDNLEKIGRALEHLRKAHYSRELMEIFVNKKTGVPITHVRAVLNSQNDYFRAIGVRV
jgi:transcriptional regulator of met regulon